MIRARCYPDLYHYYHIAHRLLLPNYPLTNYTGMFGKLDEHEIEQVIHDQVVGRIGCHHDDITYVLPISYAYDGNYIYCHSGEGMKIRMMRGNPRVCFQVDIMENMGNWKSVVAWGDYEELSDEKREEALLQLVNRKLPLVSSATTHIVPHWPFLPDNLDDIRGIVYRIRLDTKSGRFERS